MGGEEPVVLLHTERLPDSWPLAQSGGDGVAGREGGRGPGNQNRLYSNLTPELHEWPFRKLNSRFPK